MEERDAFVMKPNAAIIDGADEAIRNLNISVSLLSAILKDALINSALPVDDDTIDAFGIVQQSAASINMYLERRGLWNSNSSQQS